MCTCARMCIRVYMCACVLCPCFRTFSIQVSACYKMEDVVWKADADGHQGLADRGKMFRRDDKIGKRIPSPLVVNPTKLASPRLHVRKFLDGVNLTPKKSKQFNLSPSKPLTPCSIPQQDKAEPDVAYSSNQSCHNATTYNPLAGEKVKTAWPGDSGNPARDEQDDPAKEDNENLVEQEHLPASLGTPSSTAKLESEKTLPSSVMGHDELVSPSQPISSGPRAVFSLDNPSQERTAASSHKGISQVSQLAARKGDLYYSTHTQLPGADMDLHPKSMDKADIPENNVPGDGPIKRGRRNGIRRRIVHSLRGLGRSKERKAKPQFAQGVNCGHHHNTQHAQPDPRRAKPSGIYDSSGLQFHGDQLPIADSVSNDSTGALPCRETQTEKHGDSSVVPRRISSGNIREIGEGSLCESSQALTCDEDITTAYAPHQHATTTDDSAHSASHGEELKKLSSILKRAVGTGGRLMPQGSKGVDGSSQDRASLSAGLYNSNFDMQNVRQSQRASVRSALPLYSIQEHSRESAAFGATAAHPTPVHTGVDHVSTQTTRYPEEQTSDGRRESCIARQATGKNIDTQTLNEKDDDNVPTSASYSLSTDQFLWDSPEEFLAAAKADDFNYDNFSDITEMAAMTTSVPVQRSASTKSLYSRSSNSWPGGAAQAFSGTGEGNVTSLQEQSQHPFDDPSLTMRESLGLAVTLAVRQRLKEKRVQLKKKKADM